jgi:hypothetical protein
VKIQRNKELVAMEKPDKNNAAMLLRLPEELKAELQRQANRNGRRITSEINTRLRESLRQAEPQPSQAGSALPPSYAQQHTATVQNINEKGPASALSDTDQDMLAVFRALPVEKQRALLSLFR